MHTAPSISPPIEYVKWDSSRFHHVKDKFNFRPVLPTDDGILYTWRGDDPADKAAGLSNGSYPHAAPSRLDVPPVIGFELYLNDAVLVREYRAGVVPGGGERGDIAEWSPASRTRCVFVAQNTAVEFRSMLTLTYPNTFPQDGHICETHRRAFIERLRRKLRHDYGIGFEHFTFKEFQARGALHYHILLDFDLAQGGPLVKKCRKGGKADYITCSALHNWASKAWADIVSQEIDDQEKSQFWKPDPADYEKHIRAGVAWEVVRKTDGARRYVTKYAQKLIQKCVPEGFVNVGRFWFHTPNVKPKPIGSYASYESQVRGMLEAIGWEHIKADGRPLYKTLWNVSQPLREGLGMLLAVPFSIRAFRRSVSFGDVMDFLRSDKAGAACAIASG